MTDWLPDYSNGRPIDWLTDQSNDWIIRWLTAKSDDWLTAHPKDWLTDWPIKPMDLSTYWRTNRLTEWWANLMTDWPTEWLTDLPTKRMTDRPTIWQINCLSMSQREGIQNETECVTCRCRCWWVWGRKPWPDRSARVISGSQGQTHGRRWLAELASFPKGQRLQTVKSETDRNKE